MARLEDITVGSSVKGIVTNDTVSIVAVQWFGTNVIEVTYKNSAGALGEVMLYREDEAHIDAMFATHKFTTTRYCGCAKFPTQYVVFPE